MTLAFGEGQHAFGRGAGRDVLLLELAVGLENDERHALGEVVPQVGADLLVGALRVARDPRQVLLVFGIEVDFEVVRLVRMPLELVVVNLVLAVVRRELGLLVNGGASAALRVDGGTALRVNLRPGAEHIGGQALRVRLTCSGQHEACGQQPDESPAVGAGAHRITSRNSGVPPVRFTRSYCDYTAIAMTPQEQEPYHRAPSNSFENRQEPFGHLRFSA